MVREKGGLEDSKWYKHMMTCFIETTCITTWISTRKGI